MTRTNKVLIGLVALSLPLISGFECTSAADTGLVNIGKAAEEFEIARKLTFYNVRLGEAVKEVVGMCSVEYHPTHSEGICQREDGALMVHKLEKTEHMTLITEQLEPAFASTMRYRVLVKPSLLFPDFDVDLGTEATDGNS